METTKGKVIHGKVEDQLVKGLDYHQKFNMLVNYFTQENGRLDSKTHHQIHSTNPNNQLLISSNKPNNLQIQSNKMHSNH
jgi:hypothetical protein